MGYQPMMALTNSQQNSEGMQNAVQNFLTYFKLKKARKDDEEKKAAQAGISGASTDLGALQGKLGAVKGSGQAVQDVNALQSQVGPQAPPLAVGQAGPQGAFSPLNPAINVDNLKSGAAQESNLAPAVADKTRQIAQMKADYANRFGKDNTPSTADDFMNEDALKAEKLAQAKGTTKQIDLGNQLNAGTLSARIGAANSEAGKSALDLSTAQQTQPAAIANANLAPTETKAKIGLIGGQMNEANAKAAKDKAESEAGGNPKEIAATERQAKERFDKAGKETGYDAIKDNWANIQSAYAKSNDPKNKTNTATDYTMLDQYLKMVNPGMGVRSSNMEMFANSMGLSDKLKSGMLKVQQGGKFDPDVRSALREMAANIYANHEKSYLEKLNSIDEGLSATPGANRERVFGKTMAGRISGASQPATGGLDDADMALIEKHKPKVQSAGQ